MKTATENELILLKEVQKYSEINDKLLVKIENLKADIARQTENKNSFSRIAHYMSKSVQFMSNSHNENIASRAKAQYEQYEQTLEEVKQRNQSFYNSKL